MLLETIRYNNNLPFSVSFSNVAQEDYHYHNEMEILFVLRGTGKCKIHNVNYTIGEGDILIVDTKDLHRIFDSSDDILILDFYINLEFFNDLYPDIDYMIFACEDYRKNSNIKYQDLQKKVSVLKHHIAKTALAYINEKDNVSLLMECINDLVFILVNQFQGFLVEDNKFKADDSNDIDIMRLYKIIKYIYLNYDKRITLKDLSDIVHLNPYYISHLIKDTSGLSFQKFLNYVRLEHAEKLLLENKLTLTQISQFCGFSSLSYFNKCFKTWYNMTPAQYRKRRRPCERIYHKPFSEEVAISLLKPYINQYNSFKNSEALCKSPQHIYIPVNYSFRKGKSFKKSFPLRILFSRENDIFMLNYQKERLKDFNNISAIIDYQLLKRNMNEVLSCVYLLKSLGFPVQIANNWGKSESQADDIIATLGIPLISYDFVGRNNDMKRITTVSSALSSIIHYSHTDIYLTGGCPALFTPDGLITPYYYICQLFSQIDGTITEQSDRYMIIKGDETIYIIAFQDDENIKLKAHVHIKDIIQKGFIIERSFTKRHSCYETLKMLNNPSIMVENLKKHINMISSGNVKLSYFEANNSLDLDFEIEPGAFTFIELSNRGLMY